jgi:glycosyltransferase involved in cell wall biosynthesis
MIPPMQRKPRLLIDGVFFQLNDTGIARLWRTVLPKLAPHLSIILLDRGNSPEIEGVSVVPFPSHTMENTAAESVLIQKFCSHYKADVFTSTYYSTPLATPMFLLIYDMIPEVTGFDLSHRMWQEKELAILFSRRRICISHNTMRDLLRFYKLNPKTVHQAPCGVDRQVFKRQSDDEISGFRLKHKLFEPYFICVGIRQAATNYKNVQHFFDAVEASPRADYAIVCIGGEEEVRQELRARDGARVRILRLKPSDKELAAAYSGAEALVYPSLYEGFGLPVIEAMACECPVITTHRGSLDEVAGEAAIIISGLLVPEMQMALERVREPGVARELVSRGLQHVKRFSWDRMVECILGRTYDLAGEQKQVQYESFFRSWSELRRLQADVDF